MFNCYLNFLVSDRGTYFHLMIYCIVQAKGNIKSELECSQALNISFRVVEDIGL
jgi:hypothetical protein